MGHILQNGIVYLFLSKTSRQDRYFTFLKA